MLIEKESGLLNDAHDARKRARKRERGGEAVAGAKAARLATARVQKHGVALAVLCALFEMPQAERDQRGAAEQEARAAARASGPEG